MSNECTLGEIVYPVSDKVEGVKDPSLNYVGLEHLGSGSGYLKGYAASSTSISTNSVFRAGDVIFGKLRPNLRKSVLAPFDGYCSTDLLVLRTIEGILPEYAARVFQSEHVFRYAEKTAVGTKMPRTSWAQLKKLNIFVPHFSEQKNIANILDTLDVQIRQTEAIITKLKQVKQGLLHDLLTRGIDASGQLRSPREQSPELYKDSPLGWIPNEWELKLVYQEVDIKHGFAFDGSLFTQKPEGPTLLVPGNFHRDGELYFNKSNTKYFSGKYLDGYVLQEGDCVCVMTDLSPQTLILGRAAVLGKGQKLLHNQRIGKFLFKSQEDWDINFFAALINQDSFRRKVIANATGTTVRHTSPSKIMTGTIIKPSRSEQEQIVKRVNTFSDKVSLEVESLKKLKQQKAGLMDDLLTGRVQVTNLIEQQRAS